MRIISGSHKGRRIHPPSKLPVRPTTDLAKESLFNILTNRIDLSNVSVLDLFAGTGSLSYEFASRGARRILAVEVNHACCRFIKNTSEKLGFEAIEVIRADIKKRMSGIQERFDVIFADPPYQLHWLEELPVMIANAGLLTERGIFILEHPGTINFRENKRFLEVRKYGSVHFSFFTCNESLP